MSTSVVGRERVALVRALPPTAYMSEEQLDAEFEQLASLIDDERYEWRCRRDECDGLPHRGMLHNHARTSQLPPDWDWRIWFLMAGRGFGKTRTGAETFKTWGLTAERPLSLAVVAKKDKLCRELCFEGPSGLTTWIKPEDVASYKHGSGDITLELTNGTVIRGFSSETPDNLRGWAFDRVWLDEFASYHPGVATDVFDMAWFCMRESADPRMIITSTPKNLPHVRQLVKQARASREHGVHLTTGHMDENRANLSSVARHFLGQKYEGTRLGRQELAGELLEDIEGALWKQLDIERCRVPESDDLSIVAVAFDPSNTAHEGSDEAGIVVGGTGENGHDYVIGDYSKRVAGAEAARRCWKVWLRHEADVVVYENTGAQDWIRDVLTLVWNELVEHGKVVGAVDHPPIVAVSARKSKKARAEPVALRYELADQDVHHVGEFKQLEDEITTWVPDETKDSPNRLDALVHLLTWLRARRGRTASSSSQQDTKLPRQSISPLA
jgi:phage terminase large subunit-like protein